jgi:hypothetical protein
MPRFGIKDLLLCVTLIALGLGVFLTFRESEYWWWLCLYSPPLIGAGALTPFDRAWIGAGVGLLLAVVVLAAAPTENVRFQTVPLPDV